MADNIITAVFGATRETKVRPRYRYDVGQVLVVRGVKNLPDFYEVHFSNEGSTADATPLIGTAEGVEIPASYFQSGATIYAYIYVHNEATDGTTVYKVTIPIINRARPANVEPTPEEADIIAQAIEALNENVGKAEDAAEQSEASAGRAEAAAAGVEAFTDRAEAAAQAAEAASEGVEDYAVRAETAAQEAQSASQNAHNDAESAQNAAQNAQSAMRNAQDAALAAAQSETNASDFAAESLEHSDAALRSAEDAAAANTAAQTAKADAEAAAAAAAAAQSAAETAETHAGDSASQASTSAQSAADSASEAERVLDSIPADYSRMSADVADLKSQINHSDSAIISGNKFVPYLKWEYGSIDTNGADYMESAKWYARTSGYTPPVNTEIQINVVDESATSVGVAVVIYDASGNFESRQVTYTANTPYSVSLHTGKIYRFVYLGASSSSEGIILDITEMTQYVIFDIHTAISSLRTTASQYTYSVNGYINPINGNFGGQTGTTNSYYATPMIPITEQALITTSFTGRRMPNIGYAFYDKNQQFISGSGSFPTKTPKNAAFFRDSIALSYGTQSTYTVTVQDIGDIESESKIPTLCCYGDSVTEGYMMSDIGFANYGGDTYPSHLQTLLTDGNYNARVVNNGHSGERLPEIGSRCGGLVTYITEDLTIAASNSSATLGVYSLNNGIISGTKLAVAQKDENGNDYLIYYTNMSHDTNPVFVNGIECSMFNLSNSNRLQKATTDNVEVTLPAGSILCTSDNRNGDINLFYGGINDRSAMTLERYIQTFEKCGAVNGGKFIVIGCTHRIWRDWSDVIGATDEEKNAYYKRACIDAFGLHFIDMYTDFYNHAVKYAMDGGFLEGKTDAEIAAIQANCDNHVMDAVFCANNVEGSVHLSNAGYYVFARIVFNRLRSLNYIN